MVPDYLRAPAHNLRAMFGDRACAAISNDKGLRRYLRAHARCPELLSRASRGNTLLKTWCAEKHTNTATQKNAVGTFAQVRAGKRWSVVMEEH